MIYLMDTKLSNNLDIKTALTKIYGVNTFLSVKICKKLGFALNFKVKKMSSHQNQRLVQFFENSNFVLGYSLKQQLTIINKQQVILKTYKGLRKLKGYPVRGQRTRSNAKTSKKKL